MNYDDDLSSLVELVQTNYFNKSDDLPNDLSLFHYTNESTLRHIFANNSINIMFTNLNEQKDELEGKHIIKAFELLKERNRVVCSNIDKAINQIITELLEGQVYNYCFGFSGIDIQENYVFCLTSEKSNHYMWRNYCKGADGVNLEICNATTQMSLENILGDEYNSNYNLILKKVIYDPEKQSEILEECIEEFLSYSTSIGYEVLISYLRQLARNARYIFKDKSYQVENEYRLIFKAPRSSRLINISEYNEKIKSNVVLKFKKSDIDIVRINVSPYHSLCSTRLEKMFMMEE